MIAKNIGDFSEPALMDLESGAFKAKKPKKEKTATEIAVADLKAFEKKTLNCNRMYVPVYVPVIRFDCLGWWIFVFIVFTFSHTVSCPCGGLIFSNLNSQLNQQLRVKALVNAVPGCIRSIHDENVRNCGELVPWLYLYWWDVLHGEFPNYVMQTFWNPTLVKHTVPFGLRWFAWTHTSPRWMKCFRKSLTRWRPLHLRSIQCRLVSS